MHTRTIKIIGIISIAYAAPSVRLSQEPLEIKIEKTFE